MQGNIGLLSKSEKGKCSHGQAMSMRLSCGIHSTLKEGDSTVSVFDCRALPTQEKKKSVSS